MYNKNQFFKGTFFLFFFVLHVAIHAVEGVPMMQQYENSLPIIQCPAEDAPENKAAAIVDFLRKFSPQKPSKPSKGRGAAIERIATCIKRGRRIGLPIVGYGAKGNQVLNPGKFDAGDFAGLVTFNHIGRQISSVYEPGAEVIINNQEAYVDDINAVTQRELGVNVIDPDAMNRYRETVSNCVDRYFPYVRVGAIDCLPSEFRAIADGIKWTAQEGGVQNYQATNGSSVCGTLTETQISEMGAFWERQLDFSPCNEAAKEVLIAGGQNPSESKMRALRKRVARDIALRLLVGTDITRSILTRELYAGYPYRLSLAATDDISGKLGINVIYDSEGAPWQRIPVMDVDSGRFSIVNKSRVDACRDVYVQKSFCLKDGHKLAFLEKRSRPPYQDTSEFGGVSDGTMRSLGRVVRDYNDPMGELRLLTAFHQNSGR